MKNLSKLSLLIVFLSIFISTPVLAVTPIINTTPVKAVLLATVNIQSVKIVSQKGNIFDISFSISNGEGLQTGVKYGVRLVSESKTNPLTVDEKVYDETLTLNPNTTTKKEITYIAPSSLSGSYTLVINSKNSSGFPFGSSNLGKVTLTATTKGVEILPETCKLEIIGDKTAKTYTLTQIASINLGEGIKLTCEALNSSNADVIATPSYEVHLRTSFGDVLSQSGGSVDPIIFKSGEKKSFSVNLPKTINPQLYNLNFALNSKDSKSNTINFSYMVLGTNAIIHNLSLDKDYYNSGDKALVSLVATSNASPSVTSSIQISNAKGKSCAKTQTQALTTPIPPKVDIFIPIRSQCINPKITVTLTNDKEVVLAEKVFEVKTTSVIPSGASTKTMVYTIIILLAIILIFIYLKKKNKNLPPTTPTTGGPSAPVEPTNNILMSIIFLFILVALFGFIPTKKVSATTFGIGSLILDVNLNQTSSNYTIGSAGMEVDVDFYDNSNPYTSSISATVSISTPTLVTERVWSGNLLPISGSKQVTAISDSKLPFVAGDYTATFTIVTTTPSGQNDPVTTDPEGLSFTMKDPVNTTALPDPIVTIYANGVNPLTVASGADVRISWDVDNMATGDICTCSYSGGPCGSSTGQGIGKLGSIINLTTTSTVTVTCNN